MNSLFGSIKKLTPDSLIQLLNGSKVLLIDLRSSEEFNAGHIINAKNISLDDIESIKINKEDSIVAYGINDNEAIKAAKKLVKLGLEQAYYLEGGINSWIENSMPLSGEK
jgi:rhodanese-related sulfurtransferase|tara:strand:- start:4150 stop:4479 length:330 start_codon:yes stop_codon:yes gene_type:complete